jgi:hypothetical protein
METVTIYVGSVLVGSAGGVNDTRQKVQFEGEQLGERLASSIGRSVCGKSDTRGTSETLYRTADGRLLVHIYEWSQHPGDLSVESLHEVSAADLQPGGQYELLGADCGLGSG